MKKPNWIEEIHQPAPLPKAIPSPEEALLEKAAEASRWRRAFLLLLAGFLFFAPIAGRFAQQMQSDGASRDIAAATARADAISMAGRVAGQYAQGIAILEATARTVEHLPEDPDALASTAEDLHQQANSAVSFISAAESGASALSTTTPPMMPPGLEREIFIDGQSDLISFYAGVGARLTAALHGLPFTDADRNAMTIPLTALHARNDKLVDWLAGLQKSRQP